MCFLRQQGVKIFPLHPVLKSISERKVFPGFGRQERSSWAGKCGHRCGSCDEDLESQSWALGPAPGRQSRLSPCPEADVQKPRVPDPSRGSPERCPGPLPRSSWLWLILNRMKRVRSSLSFTNGAREGGGSHRTRGSSPTAPETGRPSRCPGSTSWPWPTTGKVGAMAWTPGPGQGHLQGSVYLIKNV